MSHDLPHVRLGEHAEADEDEDSEDIPVRTVEYLNYEVLDEHGWELDDDDLFEKAADADLDDADHGTIEVRGRTYVLDAAEAEGYEWPFECRAASCANCAGIVYDGEIAMDMDLILTEAEVEERGIVLTCQSVPVSDEVKLIYNAMYLDYLQDRVIGVREV
ncbi:ferredoxin Fer [Natronolimnohabitans sp. A-GB9]|uniref:ferredoxin Fer n=1 Tax=Natronolimnohabitans sp. A-GB9 TaxID=3069757 RepID=UPI0027B80414|nr:ferredoxin Fer [Natronolimnohabitans sp. A-GB9]MDQ2051782.1 ferredoxin Fer [Natronolimnohabitans sp. A-GB9]